MNGDYDDIRLLFDLFCSSTDFKCSSGQCIDSTSLCDGIKDCNDGSDETVGQCKGFR